MTPEDSLPPRIVPSYATQVATGPDWQLFGVLSGILAAGLGAFSLFAVFVVPRFAQIFHDFKVEIPGSARFILTLALLVADGGYIFLVPLAPILALVTVALAPRPDDVTVRTKWRRRLIRAAIWIVAIVLIATAATLAVPFIALISAVAGPQKR